MGTVPGLGTRDARFAAFGAADPGFVTELAELLADHDDALLAAYVDDPATVSGRRLRRTLAAQIGRGVVHPVFFGSAITGAGVAALTAGIRDLLPAAAGDRGRRRCPARCSRSSAARPGRRSPTSGCTRARCGRATGCASARPERRSATARSATATVTGDSARGARRRSPRSASSTAAPRPRATAVRAGQIGKLWGLHEVRIGDAIGRPHAAARREPVLAADAGRRSSCPATPRTAARCTPRSPSWPSRTR